MAFVRERRGDPLPPPAAAMRPRSALEVALCLQWAAERGMPVVARGGGSGVCGAAQPSAESLVIDLSRMARIDVDPENMTVDSQAGVYGPQLEAALTSHGLHLGHVPQSFHISTVGGWISTKAIGQLSTKYGGIEDRLLGLDAVLADGTVVSSKRVPRSSTGPDWWRMFIGAEGTLGVVTGATLSAFPIPDHHEWSVWSFESMRHGLQFLSRVAQSQIKPSVARLYDPADAAINFGALGIETGALAMLRFEGKSSLVRAEADYAVEIAEDCGAHKADDTAGPHWWEHRFDAVETYRQILAGRGALGPLGVVDTMEVAHFWKDLPALYESVSQAIAQHADMVLAHVSHLYTTGANIYFTFLISPKNEDAAEARYQAAWHAGMEATLAASGTISHHHGIGLLKAPWIAAELGSGMEALRLLKKSFDPQGRMNPGKLGG